MVMSCQQRPLMWSGPILLVLAFLPAAVLTATQGNPDSFGFKFNSGQDVQPIFEGWASNPDGSFAMYFGSKTAGCGPGDASNSQTVAGPARDTGECSVDSRRRPGTRTWRAPGAGCRLGRVEGSGRG